MDNTKIIFFLHGLNLPFHADSVNAAFEKDLLSQFGREERSQYRIITLNYARLCEENQLRLWNSQNFSWFDPVTALRLVPMRLLNMGLSFWGDPQVRLNLYASIVAKLNESADNINFDDPDSKVSLCFVGFSFGATIFVEFLSSLEKFKERGKEKAQSTLFDFTENGWKLMDRLSLIITIGCALNWHLPIRPFTRKAPDVNWVNIHYSSDVLAFGLSHQDAKFDHVCDIEVDLFHSCEKLWTWNPARVLYRMSLLAIRSTPLSHFAYFIDEDIFSKIAYHVKSDDSFTASKLSRSNSLPLLVTSPSEFNDPISIVKVGNFNGKNVSKSIKKYTFLYLHGMSCSEGVDDELSKVSKSIEHVVQANDDLDIELYSISYHHAMDKDFARRSSYPNTQFAKTFTQYRPIRSFIQKRFPVAMSYWTEKTVKFAIESSLKSHLKFMFQSEEFEDRNFVIMGNTIGSMIALSTLSSFQKELDIDCISTLPIALCQGSDRRSLLYALVTLSCPLPWFQPSPDFSPPSFTAQGCLGWLSYHVQNDFSSVSLKKAYGCHVKHETVIKKYRPLDMDNVSALNKILTKSGVIDLFASWNSCYLDDRTLWNDLANRLKASA